MSEPTNLAHAVCIDRARSTITIDEAPRWHATADIDVERDDAEVSSLWLVTVTLVGKRATVDADQRRLIVDGRPFPWLLDESGPRIALAPGTAHVRPLHIGITLLAEHVEEFPVPAQEVRADALD